MNNLPILFSPVFDGLANISHGFFTSQGGVSNGIYKSLNTGRGSNDTPKNVRENRKRVANVLGTREANLLSLHQHHSIDVIVATKPWDIETRPKADAVVTNISKIACSALAADCAPVLFVDPVARVVGAAHAGWRGALGGITDTTINAMLSLDAKRSNIRAAIGPCISQKHFEVGPEFVDAFTNEHARNRALFITGKNDRSYFDLKAYLEHKLLRTGVHSAKAITDCTYEQKQDYFSYRRNSHNGIFDYGRNISAIMLD